jgi:hypothetical protein
MTRPNPNWAPGDSRLTRRVPRGIFARNPRLNLLAAAAMLGMIPAGAVAGGMLGAETVE